MGSLISKTVLINRSKASYYPESPYDGIAAGYDQMFMDDMLLMDIPAVKLLGIRP